MSRAAPPAGSPLIAREERALWASLPVPAVLVGADDCILDISAAAEGFLNASAKAVTGTPVWDMIAVDAPLEEAFARARNTQSTLFVNDVDVGSGQRAPLPRRRLRVLSLQQLLATCECEGESMCA